MMKCECMNFCLFACKENVMHVRYLDPVSNQNLKQIFRAILIALYTKVKVTLRFERFPKSYVALENISPLQNYLLVDHILKKSSSECGSRVLKGP